MERKRIALVADDTQLPGLLDWAEFNRDLLAEHEIYATGTTAGLLAQQLKIDIIKFQGQSLKKSKKTGANGQDRVIDLLVFFRDPATPLSSDPDISALLHAASSNHIPIAANRIAADFMFPSCLMSAED
jgi:methylglyoxal synthase